MCSKGVIFLKLFHGPDTDLQKILPYNHIRQLNSTAGYDIRLVRRIHTGERPIRDRYRAMEDQHWMILWDCWLANPRARPNITAVVNAL